MRINTTSLVQRNLILVHFQYSKFTSKNRSHFWAEAEPFWTYRMALSEANWIKYELCSYLDIVLCLF